jgi:hypothetical protein
MDKYTVVLLFHRCTVAVCEKEKYIICGEHLRKNAKSIAVHAIGGRKP